MTVSSSEYGFPIFISSTDYNLIDLRAELAKYLSDLGYKPLLSSSAGFHDNFPELEPWESCLQVLQSAYVMVLVIDGKYGTTFEWKNFTHFIEDKKVSPTHAEYLFAHKSNMRMLVFIRKELLTYYQIYRTAIKNSKGDREKAKQNLVVSLPSHIEYKTLEFIEEVKTTRPIPWIKPFENVTEIKQEIQKKMLNELAELFLFKNKHLESVVNAFSRALVDLPNDKRKEILEQIGATKELKIEIESQTEEISVLKKKNEKLQTELIEKSNELEVALKENKKKSIVLQKKVENLNEEIYTINKRIKSHELINANYLISGSTTPSIAFSTMGSSPGIYGGIPSSLYSTSLKIGNMGDPIYPSIGARSPLLSVTNSCQKCHSITFSSAHSIINSLKTCSDCNRQLCNNCFNGTDISASILFNSKCEDCRKKGQISVGAINK
jgi:hypothetical protein